MLNRFNIINERLAASQNENASILVYINPTDQEKSYLVNEMKLDEHTLNSSLDPDELSRIEFEPDHSAIIFKVPRNYSANEQFIFKVVSLGVFLFSDKLIIVTSDEVPLFDGKQFNKIYSLIDLMLKLIYRSIYHYLDHLKVMNMISESLETKINESMENKYLLNLFSLEKSLVYYVNAINSNTYVIEKIKHNSVKMKLSTDNVELLDDITIENKQCYKQADIYSNILASMMDARVSIVSNNLNVLMKTLNIITITIMVPTFVVSAFSMNVSIPLQQHPLAFWIIMGFAIMSITVFVIYWRFIKKW